MSQVDFAALQGHIDVSAENNHMLACGIVARPTLDGPWEMIEHHCKLAEERRGR